MAALRAALGVLRHIDAPRLLTVTLTYLSVGHRSALRMDLARAAADEASTVARRIGDVRVEGYAQHLLGRIDLEQGHLTDAELRLRAALGAYQKTDHRPGLAELMPDLATCALERGDRVEHQRLLDLADVENHGSPFASVAGEARPPLEMIELSAAIRLGRARGAMWAGDAAGARRQLDGVRPLVERPGLDAVHDRLELALLAYGLGDRDAARSAWRAAREAVAALPPQPTRRWVDLLGLALDAPGADALDHLAAGLEDMARSLWMRRALRSLWHDLPRALRRGALGRVCGGPDALVLDRVGQALRLPGGRWLDIDRWPLWALVTALFDSPEPLEPQPLIERIWADEIILPEAAANRLYNVVAKLRKAGLTELLLRTPGGYALDPRCPRVEIDPDAPAPTEQSR